MRTLLPVTVRRQTAYQARTEVTAWKSAHPGYDASNWLDVLRDSEGRPVEGDDFFEACRLFAAHG